MLPWNVCIGLITFQNMRYFFILQILKDHLIKQVDMNDRFLQKFISIL